MLPHTSRTLGSNAGELKWLCGMRLGCLALFCRCFGCWSVLFSCFSCFLAVLVLWGVESFPEPKEKPPVFWSPYLDKHQNGGFRRCEDLLLRTTSQAKPMGSIGDPFVCRCDKHVLEVTYWESRTHKWVSFLGPNKLRAFLFWLSFRPTPQTKDRLKKEAHQMRLSRGSTPPPGAWRAVSLDGVSGRGPGVFQDQQPQPRSIGPWLARSASHVAT